MPAALHWAAPEGTSRQPPSSTPQTTTMSYHQHSNSAPHPVPCPQHTEPTSEFILSCVRCAAPRSLGPIRPFDPTQADQSLHPTSPFPAQDCTTPAAATATSLRLPDYDSIPTPNSYPQKSSNAFHPFLCPHISSHEASTAALGCLSVQECLPHIAPALQQHPPGVLAAGATCNICMPRLSAPSP